MFRRVALRSPKCRFNSINIMKLKDVVTVAFYSIFTPPNKLRFVPIVVYPVANG